MLAFNALTVAAPALSAWACFLLARALPAPWLAAFVAGLLFGFSSYELGHLVGHLNLDMTALVPLAVWLCLRRVRGKMSRPAFVAALAVVAVGQLCLSTEILATMALAGAVTWAAFLALAPRPGLWRLAADVALAALAAGSLAAPLLYALASGLQGVPHDINSASAFSADALNYAVPTNVTRVGRALFQPLARRFTGNGPEQGAYLGLPLIALLAAHFRASWRDPVSRALLAALLALVALSLGPQLQAGGIQTGLPMPWAVVERLPLIGWALPGRMTLYVALAAAVASALALAGGRSARLALAALAYAALLPNTAIFGWTPWPAQPFFTPATVERALGPGAAVIILPFGAAGSGMAWQVDAGFRFNQAGGYAGITPAAESRSEIVRALQSGEPGPDFANALAAYCAEHGVGAILIGPGAAPRLAEAVRATGWPTTLDQGVEIVRLPPQGALAYHQAEGDYWPSGGAESWMGRQMRVRAHGRPVTLTILGKWTPPGAGITLTVTTPGGRAAYPIGPSTAETVIVPAGGEATLSADRTFVPADGRDPRSLSVLVAIGP